MMDWSDIVRQYGPLVWRTGYRILNHDSDVADAFQNTFLAAWKFSQQNVVTNWTGLLQRFATIEALKRLRKRYQAEKISGPIRDEFGIDEDPCTSAISGELAEHLRLALTKIDSLQAEVFCLANFDGLAYQKIASQLGITVNHVGVLLNRAKSQLRKYLAAHQPAQSVNRSESE